MKWDILKWDIERATLKQIVSQIVARLAKGDISVSPLYRIPRRIMTILDRPRYPRPSASRVQRARNRRESPWAWGYLDGFAPQSGPAIELGSRVAPRRQRRLSDVEQ